MGVGAMAQSVKFSELPRLGTSDTGTYFIVIRNVAGVWTNVIYKGTGLMFKRDSTLYVSATALGAAQATDVKYTDSGVFYMTPAGVNVKLSAYMKISDSGVKYITPAGLSAALGSGVNNKVDTGSVAGGLYAVPIFTGRNAIGISNIMDSTNVGHIYMGDSVIFGKGVFLRNTPAASNSSDSILVKGATRGTMRLAAPPTGLGPVSVTWPGNVISLDTSGSNKVVQLNVLNSAISGVTFTKSLSNGATTSITATWDDGTNKTTVGTGGVAQYLGGNLMSVFSNLYNIRNYGYFTLFDNTSRKGVTVYPNALTANDTLRLPDSKGTLATTGDSIIFSTPTAVNTALANYSRNSDTVGGAGSQPNKVTLAWARQNYLKYSDTGSIVAVLTSANIFRTAQFVNIGANTQVTYNSLVVAGYNASGAGQAGAIVLAGNNYNTGSSTAVADTVKIYNQTGSSASPASTFVMAKNGTTMMSYGANLLTVTGGGTFGQTLTVNSSERINATGTTVTGSTSGSATFYQPETGTSVKLVVINCNALTGTASYTFPTPFNSTPVAEQTDGLSTTLITTKTTTTVTVTGSNTTGYLFLKGN